MYSLQMRLGAGLLFSLVILFLLQWLIVGSTIRVIIEEATSDRLSRDSEAILAAVSFNAEGGLQLDRQRVDPVYGRVFSGHYYVIRSGDQELRSRSIWDAALAAPTLRPGQRKRQQLPGPDQQLLTAVVRGFDSQARELTILVAENIAPVQQDIRRFQLLYGGVTALVLVLLILIQVFIVRRNLRPLEQARVELQALEQGRLDQLSTAVPREVVPLIREINRLLTTMKQRMQRSRNALGNLAHALKTPVTLLMHLGDTQEIRQHPSLRRQLLEQSGKVQELLERELKRSRLAGDMIYAAEVDLGQVARDLFMTLERLYQDKGLQLQLDLPQPVTVNLDREDLLELLGNLLDNACKWAEQTVRLTARRGGGELRLSVEDDGPGCDPEQSEQLARRGVRLDEQVAGSGLGLSIVRDLLETYDGEIGFSRSPLGGLKVEVVLPVAVG